MALRHETSRPVKVSKPVPLVKEFSRLCNDVISGSFESGSRSVDFGALAKIKIRATALFGYNDDVWKALVDVGAPHPVVANEVVRAGKAPGVVGLVGLVKADARSTMYLQNRACAEFTR